MNNQSFNSYNSLPRSSSSMASSVNSTPTNSANRTLPPRGFGTNNYVLKEDYEKERLRWQKELADAEAKLSQFSVMNTELTQVKAQLNKRIIDIEKNQKPMIECNRRLNERNKTLMDSCKNLEESVSYLRDEKLTLKDQYDRIIKENSSLREQRAFPEKLEELERYRSQVLEYSKCITALRQSLCDKERRYEMLLQKLRRIKKALTLRKEDDERSDKSFGSSIALDNIAEDLDEDPALMVNGDIQPTIYEQLEVATSIMNELRALFPEVECVNDDKSICLVSKVVRLQEDYKTLSERYNMLELELANARDSSDLFEFQLVELTSAKADLSFTDQSCETDEFVSSEFILQDEPKLNFDNEFVETAKASLRQLFNLFVLKSEHKETIHNGVSCIMGLEHKLSFANNQLDMAQCEIKRINKLIEETSASSETSSRKKKELKSIIERLKSESEAQFKELSTLQSNSELTKRQLEHVDTEKENFRKSLEESTEKINAVVESLQKANNMVEDYKQRLKTSEEQIKFLEIEINTSSRLREEKRLLESEIAKICAEIPFLNNNNLVNDSFPSLQQLAELKRYLSNYDDLEKKLEEEKRDVLQLRKFNKELTEQFNSQMDIIVQLKKRYIDLNSKNNENSKSHESISWTSSGSSDEQYHTEETRSEEAYDGVFPKKIVA